MIEENIAEQKFPLRTKSHFRLIKFYYPTINVKFHKAFHHLNGKLG